MHISSKHLVDARFTFSELQNRTKLDGVAQDAIPTELTGHPGFLTDRFEVIQDIAGSADNRATQPGCIDIQKSGLSMKGSIVGNANRGSISLTTRQADAEGIFTETHDLVRYSRDQITHYLVHANTERISALVQQVDRKSPENSWTQSKEWNLAGGH